MRLKRYLTEKWMKSFKRMGADVPDGIVEVFVNPTKKEFFEVHDSAAWDHYEGKYVRFFADMERRLVYIWNPNIIHMTVWNEIGDKRKMSDPTLLKGVAQNKGGKWTFFESDEGVKKNLEMFGIEDWQWANRWINVTKHLKKEAKRFKKKEDIRRGYL
jgi:hypothetical protein